MTRISDQMKPGLRAAHFGFKYVVEIQAARFDSKLQDAHTGIVETDVAASLFRAAPTQITVQVNMQNLWGAAKFLASKAIPGIESILP